jgi:hypothetical protein
MRNAVVPGGAPLLAFLPLGLLLGACAAPYTVRTVGKGQVALRASVGGPLLGNFGPAVPAPAAVVGGSYGVAEGWDVHGSFHVTAAAFRMAGVDLGATRRLVRQRGAVPEVTATLRLSLLGNLAELRAYPELEAYASYLLRRRVLLYLGLTTLYDFFPERDGAVRVHFGPVVGADLRLRRRHSLGVALRWISPQEDTGKLVVDYVGGRGLVLIQLGYQAHLGREGWQ